MAESSGRHMDVEYRGDLEDITRPPSNRLRAGSRPSISSAVNSAATSAGRFKSGSSAAPSLELLKPHEVLGRDLDLELEDLVSESSDEETYTRAAGDTGRSSAMFNIAEPLPDHSKHNRSEEQFEEDSEDDDYLVSRQLALFANEPDDDISVCSEEEKDIIKEIRNEITKQVKEEMKGELALYQEAKERIERGTNEDENADLDALEPKLREAILKMRKLDKVLAKRIRKEKAVKRERILLTRRLRDELDSLKTTKSVTTEEKRNTEKFLALALPPSHNAGVDVEREKEGPPVTPVFQTQLPEEHNTVPPGTQSTTQGSTRGGDKGGPGSVASSARTNNTRGESSTGSATSSMRGGTRHSKAQSKKNKDFIKRNMELAADAANTIAMTDDEKKHVEDLLADLDQLPEVPEDMSCDQSEHNPFQVALTSGEGFRPDDAEADRLHSIDDRLRMLLPEEDFKSICGTPSSLSSSSYQTKPNRTRAVHKSVQGSQLFTRTIMRQPDIDIDELGEHALRETKEHRDVQYRLKAIEEELSKMSEAVDNEIASPTLTEDQLEHLLDQCARTMSRATAETTSLSQSSVRSGISTARSSLYENPPKLPDDVLQELLADARRSIGGSATPTRGIKSRETDDCMLESVSEDTIKELLVNARTTSRMAAQSRASTFTSPTPPSSAQGHNYPSFPNDTLHVEHPVRTPKESKRPFLPEIDPKGTLSTQSFHNNNSRMNNQESVASSRASSSAGRLSAISVHNSFTESLSMDRAWDARPQIPHPPSESRRSSSGKSRTVSPGF